MVVGHDGWRWQERQCHTWLSQGTKPEEERDRFLDAVKQWVHA